MFLTVHNTVDCSFLLSMNWEDKERFYWTCAGSKFSEEYYSMYLGFSVVLVMSLFELKVTNFLSGLYHLFSIYSSVTSLLWQVFPTTLKILMMKPLDGFHGEAKVWRRTGGVRLKQLGERIFQQRSPRAPQWWPYTSPAQRPPHPPACSPHPWPWKLCVTTMHFTCTAP